MFNGYLATSPNGSHWDLDKGRWVTGKLQEYWNVVNFVDGFRGIFGGHFLEVPVVFKDGAVVEYSVRIDGNEYRVRTSASIGNYDVYGAANGKVTYALVFSGSRNKSKVYYNGVDLKMPYSCFGMINRKYTVIIKDLCILSEKYSLIMFGSWAIVLNEGYEPCFIVAVTSLMGFKVECVILNQLNDCAIGDLAKSTMLRRI